MMHYELLTKQVQELFQKIYELNLEVADLKRDPYQSEEQRELIVALVAAQGEYPSIDPNRDNPQYKSKYPDIEGLIEPLRPILLKYGLCLSGEEHFCAVFGHHLRLRVCHISGQWKETRSPLNPGKPGDQGYGATLSYRTRYSIKTLLLIPVSKDPAEDDGEDERKHLEAKPKPEPISVEDQKIKPITAYQVDQLKKAMAGSNAIYKKFMDELGLQDLAAIEQGDYMTCLTLIETLKKG